MRHQRISKRLFKITFPSRNDQPSEQTDPEDTLIMDHGICAKSSFQPSMTNLAPKLSYACS